MTPGTSKFIRKSLDLFAVFTSTSWLQQQHGGLSGRRRSCEDIPIHVRVVKIIITPPFHTPTIPQRPPSPQATVLTFLRKTPPFATPSSAFAANWRKRQSKKAVPSRVCTLAYVPSEPNLSLFLTPSKESHSGFPTAGQPLKATRLSKSLW